MSPRPLRLASSIVLVLPIVLVLGSPSALPLRAAEPTPTTPLPDGLYAEFSTPGGTTTVELLYTQAPLMCVNFTGLAEGTLAQKNGKPFYTGLTFYRVVPGFVIQSGNPGLKDTDALPSPVTPHFPDEFVPSLRHDAAGILSMANAGPDTNSCEFFLTLAPTNRLNYLHSVFGRTIRGLNTLALIRQDDPVSIKILRIGSAAKAFRADPATFVALSAAQKKYAAAGPAPTALAAKDPSPLAHFTDPDKLLPAVPPRAENFNYKLANFERTTGLRIAARVFAKSPTAAEDHAPGAFMKALAAQLGVTQRGAVAAYFADDNDWRVWLIGDATTHFFGRVATPAELGDGAAFHDVKEAFTKAAQAEGDAAYELQKKSAPADNPPPAGQRIKLQTDAILDGLIHKLDPK